jgi:glycosyltransferase involved in cell wall biosynthesis
MVDPTRGGPAERCIQPAVSVVMPCYNLGRYVHEAIDSVLAQTRQDFEIVVVNDGSTDAETNQILAGLRYPRTTVLTTENRGLPAARNLAIQHSTGTYVCALDADDKLHPQFLEKTLGILDSDPSVSFVSTWVECFGEESWNWRQERCDFPKLLAECVVLTASPVRREALDEVGGYDCERYLYGSEDWDLWISLVERERRGAIVPETLFYYRQRSGSMRRVADAGPIRTRVWQTLLEKHRASYVRFLPDVLLLKEEACGRLLLDNRNLERDLETRLEPLLAERRAELDRLGGPPDDASDAAAIVAPPAAAVPERLPELEAARTEVAALRSSKSWRLTAPLRRAYDVWLAARRWFPSKTGG